MGLPGSGEKDFAGVHRHLSIVSQWHANFGLATRASTLAEDAVVHDVRRIAPAIQHVGITTNVPGAVIHELRPVIKANSACGPYRISVVDELGTFEEKAVGNVRGLFAPGQFE